MNITCYFKPRIKLVNKIFKIYFIVNTMEIKENTKKIIKQLEKIILIINLLIKLYHLMKIFLFQKTLDGL